MEDRLKPLPPLNRLRSLGEDPRRAKRDADERGVLDRSRRFVDGGSVRATSTPLAREAVRKARRWAEAGASSPPSSTTGQKAATYRLSSSFPPDSVTSRSCSSPLMEEEGRVKRAGHRSPKIRPECAVADKGCSHDRVRRYLACRKVAAVIPLRSDKGHNPNLDRGTYRQRNKAERPIGCLEQWRRIATRYEKRASNYPAMLTLATIVLGL